MRAGRHVKVRRSGQQHVHLAPEGDLATVGEHPVFPAYTCRLSRGPKLQEQRCCSRKICSERKVENNGFSPRSRRTNARALRLETTHRSLCALALERRRSESVRGERGGASLPARSMEARGGRGRRNSSLPTVHGVDGISPPGHPTLGERRGARAPGQVRNVRGDGRGPAPRRDGPPAGGSSTQTTGRETQETTTGAATGTRPARGPGMALRPSARPGRARPVRRGEDETRTGVGQRYDPNRETDSLADKRPERRFRRTTPQKKRLRTLGKRHSQRGTQSVHGATARRCDAGSPQAGRR